MSNDLKDVHEALDRIRAEIAKRVVGLEPVIDQVLACILCDGNALLESNPGLGKTLLVRTIADVTDLDFSRIQNTPDLMPSDIVGTEVIHETGDGRAFRFQKGPVFANIVLADEINRATPKTQSALLEAMQERQVTAAGQTYALPRPFFLLATQNPIDQEGSLHPDESLYMDGRLWTAEAAIEHARENGELAHETQRTRVYDVNATTQALTPAGELIETECLVYETDYTGAVYTVETATGRSIRVSGNHPFLSRRDGVIQWVEAHTLRERDSLVAPRRLDLPERPFPTHGEALEPLESRYGHGVVRRDQIDDAFTLADAGFFVGFLLAAGSVSETAIRVSQKTRPALVDRWTEIAERIGLDPAIREGPAGREARIRSKPLVKYLDERFHLTEPERLLSAPKPFRGEFLDTFLRADAQYDAQRRRITLVQTDRSLTNLIAHLLLGIGIVPSVSERDDRYELGIKGNDLERYRARRAGCWGDRDVDTVESAHRPPPVSRREDPRLDAIGMIDDDAIPSRRRRDADRAIQTEPHRLATPYPGGRLEASAPPLEHRRRFTSGHTAREATGTAGMGGLSATDVIGDPALSTHQDQQATPTEGTPGDARSFVDATTDRIPAAQRAADRRRDPVGDVMYDPVASIDAERYAGPVIGLSVPDHHNYVAGLGACGISHNTYPLPEAQSDRFLMKIFVDFPSFDEERAIVDRYTRDLEDTIPVDRVVASEELRDFQRLTREVPIADDLRDEAISIVQSTRDTAALEFGASPRASMALVLAAKARALLEGRPHVSYDDLVAMAPPVLRHRIILTFRAERDGRTPDDVIRDIV